MPRYCAIISWGPVESLRNGYFIRTYSLAELLSRACDETVIIEYTEENSITSRFYKIVNSKIGDCARLVKVKGNEKALANKMLRYARFILWQIVNTLKLLSILRKSDFIVFAGELFLPSLLLAKILLGNKVLRVCDPQMLLSEREMRTNRKILARLLTFFEKLFFLGCDVVVAISNNMKSRICALTDCLSRRISILVIPHTLPENLRRSLYCDKLSLRRSSERRLTSLFIGDLNAEHNYASALFLIRVMKLLDLKLREAEGRDLLTLKLVGRASEERRRELIELVKRLGFRRVTVEVVGYVDDLDDYICREADVLLAPMFTMSGVSTKMLYYLRFRNKKILASKEAVEGLEDLISNADNVLIANTPKEFYKKLYSLVRPGKT